ncbi:hypothetical protein BDY24DRAFT_399366 [Mrakia frigida]|uniref:uncharacterized protein n=1 Tax=Mrakia frigida TaxID=29902 RepID=UPI003FCBF32D
MGNRTDLHTTLHLLLLLLDFLPCCEPSTSSSSFTIYFAFLVVATSPPQSPILAFPESEQEADAIFFRRECFGGRRTRANGGRFDSSLGRALAGRGSRLGA